MSKKLIVRTAARLFVTLTVAVGTAMIWEGFNQFNPPATGSLRAWAFDLWRGMMGR